MQLRIQHIHLRISEGSSYWSQTSISCARTGLYLVGEDTHRCFSWPIVVIHGSGWQQSLQVLCPLPLRCFSSYDEPLPWQNVFRCFCCQQSGQVRGSNLEIIHGVSVEIVRQCLWINGTLLRDHMQMASC